MTVTAPPPRLARPNEKPAPNSDRVMVGNDVLFRVFFAHGAAATPRPASMDAARGRRSRPCRSTTRKRRGERLTPEPLSGPGARALVSVLARSSWRLGCHKFPDGGLIPKAIAAAGSVLGILFVFDVALWLAEVPVAHVFAFEDRLEGVNRFGLVAEVGDSFGCCVLDGEAACVVFDDFNINVHNLSLSWFGIVLLTGNGERFAHFSE